MDKKRAITSVNLGKELSEWLTAYANEQGLSRSYIIRELLAWMKEEIDVGSRMP